MLDKVPATNWVATARSHLVFSCAALLSIRASGSAPISKVETEHCLFWRRAKIFFTRLPDLGAFYNETLQYIHVSITDLGPANRAKSHCLLFHGRIVFET